MSHDAFDGPEPDGPALDALIIGPEAPSGLVIWLHGLGADGHDFAPVVPLLQRPDLRFVLPHAPERPVTINGGIPMPAWYDITRMAPGPGREPEEDVRDTGAFLRVLIEDEQARGISASRTLVVGFSQGGAMALHVALRWPERLAGVVALSTYLVLPEFLDAELSGAVRDMPAFFGHGSRDPTVPMQRGRAAHDRLAGTLDTEWRDYPMGHELCGEEIRDLRQWIDRVLPAPG
jgi:phospholipase/carboxylesterase